MFSLVCVSLRVHRGSHMTITHDALIPITQELPPLDKGHGISLYRDPSAMLVTSSGQDWRPV